MNLKIFFYKNHFDVCVCLCLSLPVYVFVFAYVCVFILARRGGNVGDKNINREKGKERNLCDF